MWHSVAQVATSQANSVSVAVVNRSLTDKICVALRRVMMRMTSKLLNSNRSLFSRSSLRHDPASVRGEEVNPLRREMQRHDFARPG